MKCKIKYDKIKLVRGNNKNYINNRMNSRRETFTG